MPFTLSHAAAALPLRRLKLITSALVIGTLAPDFEYFVRLTPGHGYGHRLPGVFVLTLPLALVTLWLFHAVVKRPLVELFPDAVRRRLTNYVGEFRFGGAARFALIVVSILTGIATHLIWDSFTHSDTWLFRHWRPLHATILFWLVGPVSAYKVLQLASSILGILALLIWALMWYRNAKPADELSQPSPRSLRGILILAAATVIAAAGAALRSVMVMGIPASWYAEKHFLILWIITAIPLLWWQLVVYGLLRYAITRQEVRSQAAG